MVAEKLSVASSDPVSLDDVPDKKTESKKTDSVSTSVDKALETPKESKDSVKKDAEESKSAEGADSNKETEIQLDDDTKIDTDKGQLSKETQGSNPLDSSEEVPPPRPQRPLSPMAQIKKDLHDAFPQIEEKYIHACLIASGGLPDPAFSALLYLLDPSYEPEIEQPPPLPSQRPATAPSAGLTDDELLARQLQKEFDKEERKRRIRSSQRSSSHRGAVPPAGGDDSPDEFEQLKESFTQGFEEAKLTLNSWVSGISKNFGGDDKPAGGNNGGSGGGAQNPKLFGALGGSSFNKSTQRATNFDDDPEILSLNFQRNLDMRDHGAAAGAGKPQPVKKDTKWQPLNSDAPMSSDAFLVTDSEDEDKDVKKP